MAETGSVASQIEILLEIEDSRKELVVTPGSIIENVEAETGAVILLPGNGSGDATAILQRWTSKWGGTFIDIKAEEEIVDGDRVRVITSPRLKSVSSRAGYKAHCTECIYNLRGLQRTCVDF